jgi:hypothetical protein
MPGARENPTESEFGMPMIDVYATKGTFNRHVAGLAGGVGDCGSWQVVDERSGVVLEQRDLRHLLPPHHGLGKVLGERVLVAERSCGGVGDDHGHSVSP